MDHQLRGSTLLEALIAMIIVVITTTIFSVIYINVMFSNSLSDKTTASLLLNEELDDIQNEKLFIDENKRVGNIVITKHFDVRPESENSVSAILTAKNANGQVLARLTKLLLINDN